MNPSSDFEDLREIVTTVETRLRPIPEIRMHISRFMDGADMDEVYPRLYLGDWYVETANQSIHGTW